MSALEALRKTNPKYARFVEELSIDFDRVRAAEEAGFKGKHVKRRAFELMQRQDVNDALEELLNQKSIRTNIDAEKVITDLEITRRMALARGALSVARRCSVDQAKLTGLYQKAIDPNADDEVPESVEFVMVDGRKDAEEDTGQSE